MSTTTLNNHILTAVAAKIEQRRQRKCIDFQVGKPPTIQRLTIWSYAIKTQLKDPKVPICDISCLSLCLSGPVYQCRSTYCNLDNKQIINQMCCGEHREHANPQPCQLNQYLCLNICLFTPLIKIEIENKNNVPSTLFHIHLENVLLFASFMKIYERTRTSSWNITYLFSAVIFNIIFLHPQSSSGNIITLPPCLLTGFRLPDCQTVVKLVMYLRIMFSLPG